VAHEVDELAPEETARLSEFLKRAQEGDESMLPLVRRLIQEPGVVDRLGGDLGRSVERELVQRTVGNNLLLREALLCKLESLRSEHAGPDATLPERLLADRVVLSWLALHEAEINNERTVWLTIAQADFHRRRIDSLHRRFLSAVKTLATVRRLAVPVLRGKLNAHAGTNGKGAALRPNVLEKRFALPPD
jgi:hypothetical protein